MEILVVDDSKLMREMVIASLRGLSGASFTQAASGLEAIEKLSLSPFDLVFLDLNMPDLGGVEVVQFIREQEGMQELPVVIVTTRGDDASRARVLSAGATRFMTKPFDPEQIVDVARALVSEEPGRDG
ncbi:MAG TPA: response regulator [Polyangiales bacterium]|nr:response regulator [Polyangiales bacterium]